MTVALGSELDALLRELPGAAGPSGQAQVIRWNCKPEDTLAAVRTLAAAGGRLADMFAIPARGSSDGSEALQRVIVFALDSMGVYVELSSPITDGASEAFTNFIPGAYLEECEIFELWGCCPRAGLRLTGCSWPPTERRAVLSGELATRQGLLGCPRRCGPPRWFRERLSSSR